MVPAFPEPTDPHGSMAAVLLGYLDFFRETIVAKEAGLADTETRTSRLPSGWTPLALLRHVTWVERRWLVWGFVGETVAEPWGDHREGRWFVPENTSRAEVVQALRDQGRRTREIVESHDLGDVGAPGPRWDGAPPATLHRVLLHLVQEHARHAGHLDVVRELVDGTTGE